LWVDSNSNDIFFQDVDVVSNLKAVCPSALKHSFTVRLVGPDPFVLLTESALVNLLSSFYCQISNRVVVILLSLIHIDVVFELDTIRIEECFLVENSISHHSKELGVVQA
jgi:hypothetical protein